MKLIYLYIRDYNILNDIEFNFDSEHRFHFDKDRRELTQINAENPLPEDFFTINKKGNDRVVESVSAIIGNNGSGKTSIARFLHDLSFDISLEHIVIWKKDNQLNYKYLIVPEILNDGEFDKLAPHLAQYDIKKMGLKDRDNIIQKNYTEILEDHYPDRTNIKDDQERKYLAHKFSKQLGFYELISKPNILNHHPDECIDLIYSSNYYTPMHGISAVNSIKDISTSYLMRADYEKYLNPHTGINLSIDRIKAHDCKDFQRNVKFFKEFYLKKEREASPKNLSPTGKKSIGENDNWSIPLPLGVSISMNSNDLYILKSLIKDGNMNESKELENENQELKLKDYLSKIINILESKNKNDFLHKTRLCFLGNHFRYILGSSSISSDILEVYNKAAKSFSEKLETNCNDHFNCFQDFLDDFVKNCKNHPNSKQDSQTVHTFSSNIYNGFRTAKKLFTFLKKNSNLAKGNDKLYFDIKENINTFLEFAELYFDCNTITHFFDFSWEPYISAGEYAQLNIYSRLFSVKEFHEGKKEFIVFFDEIEITVHPELQLELLSNLIKFFEIFFYGHKVHLFFASHSPVLLSDIPKANVCFIKRDGYDTKIVNPETDNTFGANIHSLYRHSFFMENGTIGTLAAKRINEAIALLINSNDNNSKSSLEDYLKEETKVKQIIDLIGEPIIKEKLTSMYIDKYCNTPGKKIAYLKEQIKELEKLSPQENGNE